uniref:Uncharacterized protein n=1 Tax=Psilocybe cubensis TaxID=181762 RepID=A0A8H7Y5L6_PSICU
MFALGGALLAAAAIIFGLCIALAFVLLVILCVTAIITAFGLFSYFFFRLAILLRREGWSGILNPTGETKERFDFWGPAYNLLSSSTMKESVARSQPQAEKPQYENQPVGNK